MATEPLDLEAIKARTDKASTGPWAEPEYDEDERAWFILNGRDGMEQHAVACVAPAWSRRFAEANADFIAHARTDVPALLDELERLRAEMYAIRDLAYRAGAGREGYAIEGILLRSTSALGGAR